MVPVSWQKYPYHYHWFNAVGIATGYGLDDRGVGYRVPVRSRILSSLHRPDRLWGSYRLLSNEFRGLWPLTSMTCFGGAVNRNNFYILVLFFTSLHISTSTNHPQVKYTQSFLETITPTKNPFLGYTVYYFILCYVIYYNLKLEVKIENLPPTSTKVKETRIYTSTSPYASWRSA
jgi:hypothetical protein